MKKVIIIVILSIISTYSYAQNDKQRSPMLTFSGGLWAGFNKSTKFVGFVGPKFAVSFPINSKNKLELGINGIPGAVLDKNLKNTKFGLTIGSTLMLKKDNWKIKPIIGCALLKTDKWQTLYGLGFVF